MAVLYVKDIETGKFVPIKQLQGYTPQKGIDYFTEAEKAEFVADVTNNITPTLESKANSKDVYTKTEVDTKLGDIETALDSILAMQEALIGGDNA